jgi:Myb-like DNA-binding domain
LSSLSALNMGNSPSQQTAEGAQGEPDDFDLDAISDGSGDEETKITREKNTTPKTNSRKRKQSSFSPAPIPKPYPVDSSARKVDYLFPLTNRQAKVSSSSEVPEVQPANPVLAKRSTVNPRPKGSLAMMKRNRPSFDEEGISGRNATEALDDHDYLPSGIEDLELVSPDDTSIQPIPVTPPNPTLRTTRSKTTENKRKRISSIVQETPARQPKKQRLQRTSLPTPVTSTDRELEGIRQEEAHPRASGKVRELTGPGVLQKDAVPVTDETKSPRRLRKPHSRVTPNAIDSRIRLDDEEPEEPPSRRGMATSVAKRTFDFVVKDAGIESPNHTRATEDTSSVLDVEPERGHKSIVEVVIPSLKEATKRQPRPKATPKEQGPGSALKRPSKHSRSSKSKPPPNLEVAASDDESDFTVSKRKSAPRGKTYHCLECEEEFKLRNLLKKHEKEAGHGHRVSGRFSDAEVHKLKQYKNSFCTMYGIDSYAFNEMMTESCRRGAGHQWAYAFITKADFLAQYYEVLPNRNRKSMSRYRERNWQNATGSKDWTKEDDDQIVTLVKVLGPKWVEISQRLTRTQDAVQQRWVKFLQFRESIKRGGWTTEETELLEKAVAGAKKKGGLSQDASTDERVAWSIVSDALNHTRTPKQCADRWHFLRDPAEIRRARRKKEAGRRRALRPTSDKQKKELSEKYVDDSGDRSSEKESNDEARDNRIDAILSKDSRQVRDTSGELEDVRRTLGAEDVLQEPSTSNMQSDDDDFISASQSRPASKSQHSHESSAASEPTEDDDIDDEDSGANPLEIESAPEEITPTKITTLSQAFANTQANASARRKQRALPTKGRPSPNIPMKLRPQSPVVEETPTMPDELEDVEMETQESSTFTSTSPQRATAVQLADDTSSEGETESSSSSDEDDEAFGVSKKPISSQSAKTASSTSESEDDEVETADAEDEKEETREQDPPSISPWVGSSDARKVFDAHEDSTSSSGSDSESDSDEESDESDAMVAEVRNDFMESIKATARKAELARQQRNNARNVLVDVSDSEESEDGDIEHG